MQMPALVEYLLSAERKGGGELVGHGGQQTTIPYFPPSTSLSFQSTPIPGYYAVIGWYLQPGRIPVDCFTAVIQQWGQQQYSGVVTERMIVDGFPTYMVVTDQQPIRWRITNDDTIAHPFEVVTHYVTVANAETLEIARGIVRRRRQTDGDLLLLANIDRALSQVAGTEPVKADDLDALVGGRR